MDEYRASANWFDEEYHRALKLRLCLEIKYVRFSLIYLFLVSKKKGDRLEMRWKCLMERSLTSVNILRGMNRLTCHQHMFRLSGQMSIKIINVDAKTFCLTSFNHSSVSKYQVSVV